ncbi:MAG: hypothetical protein QOF76_4140 [Solirubrobacteraceae bacterium]|nr:hypothetical protein [Solirubrobacteraceae bacterium]
MDGVWPDTDARGPKCARPPLDRAIADLAAAQHGLIALPQLRDLGLGARGVSHRVSRGALHRVHRGVYGVGHPLLTKQGRYMGAVLACGPGSALSYRSAADLRSLRRTSRTGIDVSSPRRAGRPIAGIDVHSGAALLERDVEIVDGIPCTSVARTLLDLAAVVPRRQVERAFDQADVLQVLDATAIEDVLGRTNGHRGNAMLRSILDDHVPGSTPTKSKLEEAFLETDSRGVHAVKRAFEKDRRRDQRLMLAGYRVVRFPYKQVLGDPDSVRATLVGLLRAAA